MVSYLEIINSLKFDEIYQLFFENRPVFEFTETKDSLNQYHVKDHNVMINDELHRPDKSIDKAEIGVDGQPRKDVDGNVMTRKATAKVNRVPLSFQNIIVERRIGFLLGNKIKYDCTFNSKDKKEKLLIDYVYKIQDSAKTDYANKELARRMMSELECAELWYLVEDVAGTWGYIAQAIGISKPKFQLKMKVLSPALKDELYPLKDVFGDMIAFGRKYKLKEDGCEIEHFDIYTAEFTFKYANRGGWALDILAAGGGKVINLTKKIPVVYHSQPKPEWSDVQGMIDRIEKVLSNHGDMNDYFGEPILAIFGQLIQAINKGESGKILQLSENAKASFLALDSPPESIKMEVENLEKFIYALSQTPNISFSELKSIGTLSGIALKMMFMDAHLAVIAKEELFGIGIQRRVNLIKSIIGNVLDVSLNNASQTVSIKPVFTPFMPVNMKEEVDTIGSAVGSGILSKKTATEKLEDLGYIADAVEEQIRLQEEGMVDLANPTL